MTPRRGFAGNSHHTDAHPSSGSGTLVILGAGVQEYREYGLRQIAANHRVAVVDSASPGWTRGIASMQIVADLTNQRTIAAAVTKLAAEHPLSGVLTYLENHVEISSRVAHGLELPGASPESVAACRDKALTRRLLAEAKVPSARSHVAYSVDHAVELADLLGYPVVVKPRALAGSAGVQRADSSMAVRSAFLRTSGTSLLGLGTVGVGGVLIEEYLDGPEISVECVVLGPGQVQIAAVTRKYLTAEPAFDEVSHTVDANDDLLTNDAVRRVATEALVAVGITHGVMHVEMRLTSDRGPRIIEINARLGGDLIPRLVHLATGVNLAQVAAALATGVDPDLRHSRRRAAGIRFLYPRAHGRIETLQCDIPAASWVERFVWTRTPGDQVSPPPCGNLLDRLAHTVVTGPDAATCQARLQLVEDRTNVRLTPAVIPSACVR